MGLYYNKKINKVMHEDDICRSFYCADCKNKRLQENCSYNIDWLNEDVPEEHAIQIKLEEYTNQILREEQCSVIKYEKFPDESTKYLVLAKFKCERYSIEVIDLDDHVDTSEYNYCYGNLTEAKQQYYYMVNDFFNDRKDS